MVGRRFPITLLLIGLAGSSASGGDDVRYFEKDGVTYREVRRVVERPVMETRLQASTQTVYRQRDTVEWRDATRQRWTPVTEYRWEACWVGQWNPLAQPYLAYRYVERTRWVQSTETVKTPVIHRRVVPETQTVQTPVTAQRTVQQYQVVSRVAVDGAPASQGPWTEPARMASVPQATNAIGGVARLESDPPAVGPSMAWRAASDARR
jgi:hypothetical protein